MKRTQFIQMMVDAEDLWKSAVEINKNKSTTNEGKFRINKYIVNRQHKTQEIKKAVKRKVIPVTLWEIMKEIAKWRTEKTGKKDGWRRWKN